MPRPWITFFAALSRMCGPPGPDHLPDLRDPHVRKWCKRLCEDYTQTPEELRRAAALFDLPCWQGKRA